MPAGANQKARQLYAFGPFRVDPEREILTRDGEPVPLTPKTFQILLVLVRRSNEVVTKDDLMAQVWRDTFVEEANLSRNIFMLRKALGETPQEHRYIVTVPGRGYRFAENVQVVADGEWSKLAARLKAPVEETNRKRWIAVFAALVIVVAAGTVWLLLHRPPVLTEKDTIVLADFANSTGDSVFDGALRQAMEVELEQSPYLALISDDRIQRTLRFMGTPAASKLTPDVAREICERTASAAVLEGSISKLGSQYVLGLSTRNCYTGDVLEREQVQVGRKEDVLDAMSEMARRFRARAGESLGSIEKHQTPLAEATTPSLEALTAYSTAWKIAFTSGFSDAVPFFKRATQIDPQFAMAYASLGRMYGDIGESALSAESASKAYQLRDRASERERFFIETNYDRQVAGNLEKSRQDLESWAQTYPRDAFPHSLLSGFTSQGAGNYDRAIQEAKRAIELDPDITPAYMNLASSYFYLDRIEEASGALQLAAKRGLEIPDTVVLSYFIAFLNRDQAGMESAIAAAKGQVRAEDWILHSESLVQARSGQLRTARSMSREAVDLATQAGQMERAATFLTGRAVWEALFGNASAAQQSATTALKLSNGRDVEYAAAFALAESGDDARAQVLADDLAKRFANDTPVRVGYSPTLQALIALKHNEPQKAVDLLQTSAPYDLAVPRIDIFGYFGGLYAAYVRGNAYLALHQGTEAAAEFQKILDHRGIVAGDPVGALARLQLGRAYALDGDKTKAQSAYEDFLTLLNDADPDIPALKQAKAEYAKLK